MGVAAYVFRNGAKCANEDNAIGLDRQTGETLFSDDRSFDWSVIAEEFIGNAAEVAALADSLKFSPESEPVLRTFLSSGSHSGDVLPIEGIGLVAESASTLLLDPQRQPDVVIFLKKVLRLCSAALSEDSPIFFV